MSIENEIFKKSKVNMDKLIRYGFIFQESSYNYSKTILDNSFIIEVAIDSHGSVRGKVFDLATSEEYTNFRIKYNVGAFAGTIREEFETLLDDIKCKCFDSKFFIYEQSNRIANLIKEKYQDLPVFLWERNPGFGVFKNKNSQKWYAVIMNIDKSKLGDGSGEIEALNLKITKEEVALLLQADGFYPAYHMNKKGWITICLDGRVTDEYIMSLIDESYDYADTGRSAGNEWVIPANPKYYNVEEGFKANKITTWHQRASMKPDDYVYIYMTNPLASIMYKCKVLETDIQHKGSDGKVRKIMKIELVAKYPEGKYSLTLMKKYGVGPVRGARHMTEELSKAINGKS